MVAECYMSVCDWEERNVDKRRFGERGKLLMRRNISSHSFIMKCLLFRKTRIFDHFFFSTCFLGKIVLRFR